MMKLLAATVKELLLLKRDSGGLMVLFLMPAFLVVLITLVQENVMELTGQKKTQVALLDLDLNTLGPQLKSNLSSDFLEVIDWDATEKKEADLEEAIEKGDYQVGLVLPHGSTALFTQGNTIASQRIPVRVYFDPGIMPGLRTGLSAQIEMALTALSIKSKVAQVEKQMQNLLAMLPQELPQADLPLMASNLSQTLENPLLVLENSSIKSQAKGLPPYNPVQQNVPAWALFGMFFTAIPIAGSILEERKSGVWIRLRSLPVSITTLFAGKIFAYIGICCCQFFLTALLGFYLFPLLGLPAFTVAPNVVAVMVTIFFISLGACGYGIFLGMACSSYEQASTIGSTSVVTAAAMGGVMVPVYAMPELMQKLSILSPLNWGLTAFNDLLMRGFPFSAIVADLARLFLFFILSITLAWYLSRRNQ